MSSKFPLLRIAVATVSDSRSWQTDDSGALLATLIAASGHDLAARDLVPDDIYQLRALISGWISATDIEVIITTGGTGFTGRDNTPEALTPLFDKQIEGFGELFRSLSFDQIGTSSIQSRALAGLANGTLIFCLPGSANACKTGWDMIIQDQLNVDHRPCNFVELIPRFKEC